MKLYNYLLFCLYNFYAYRLKEKSGHLISVTIFSTVIIYINLFTVYVFMNYLELLPMFPNKYFVIVIMISLGVVNYYFIVRHKKFLNQDFKRGIRGGIIVIVYLILTTIAFILVANLNRAKLEKQRLERTLKTEQKPSLEEKVEKWFKE